LTHFAAPSFWTEYAKLPKRTQKLADNAFTRLKENPQHPALQFKQVGRYWSARVNMNYRAVAVKAPDGWVWFWIGTHAEYDKLIK
jgi:hypothetical protein